MIDNKTVAVTRTERREIELHRDDILQALRAAGVDIPENARVSIYFAVPGGGDWSSTNIDISAEHPVYVDWTTEEESHG